MPCPTRSFAHTTLLLAIAWLSFDQAALATPSESDRQAADLLLRQAQAERSIGNDDRALSLYQRAEALKTTPVAGLEVAKYLERKGDLNGAIASLRAAIGLSDIVETPATTKARTDARELLERWLPRVPLLTIAVASTLAGVDISLDGKPILPNQWNTKLELPSGTHVIELRLHGQLRESRALTAHEGARLTETFSVQGAIELHAPPSAHCLIKGPALTQDLAPNVPTPVLVGTYGVVCKLAESMDNVQVLAVTPGQTTRLEIHFEPLPECDEPLSPGSPGASAPSANPASTTPREPHGDEGAATKAPFLSLGVRGGEGAFLAMKPDIFTIVGKNALTSSSQFFFGIAAMADVYLLVGTGNIQWMTQLSLGLPGGAYISGKKNWASSGIYGSVTTGLRLSPFPNTASSFIFEPGIMLGSVKASTNGWSPPDFVSVRLGVGCTFDRTSELTLQLSFGAVNQVTFLVGKTFAL